MIFIIHDNCTSTTCLQYANQVFESFSISNSSACVCIPSNFSAGVKVIPEEDEEEGDNDSEGGPKVALNRGEIEDLIGKSNHDKSHQNARQIVAQRRKDVKPWEAANGRRMRRNGEEEEDGKGGGGGKTASSP